MTQQKKQTAAPTENHNHATTNGTPPGFADYNLFWQNPVAILVLPARSFRVASANRAATQLFDLNLEQLLGWDIGGWLSPHAVEEIHQSLWARPGGEAPTIDAVRLLQPLNNQTVKLLATNLTLGSGSEAFWALFCDRRHADAQGPNANLVQDTPLANFLHSMPVPAWILNGAGDYVMQNALSEKLPRCQNLKGNTCTPARILEVGCGLAPGDPEKNWFHLHAEVLASGEPRETQVDLGSCGVWRIVLFPVRQATDPLLVGGTAFNVTQQETSRRETEAYLAQLRTRAKEFESIRETERQDIAREIHDTLGQEVTFLKLGLSRLRREALSSGSVPPEILAQVMAMEQQVDVVTRASRRIHFDLRPDVVHSAGLAVATHNLVLDVRRQKGIRGQLELDGNWRNPPTEMGVHLYRCLQEILNNMTKHSRAQKFVVRLMLRDNAYLLEVLDNGIGLPREFVTGQKPDTPITSRGLRGLYERAAIYGGKVTLGTRPDYDGSLIKLEFPFSAGE